MLVVITCYSGAGWKKEDNGEGWGWVNEWESLLLVLHGTSRDIYYSLLLAPFTPLTADRFLNPIAATDKQGNLQFHSLERQTNL